MSAKQAATYHGADIVTRLRVQAPYSDDGQAMIEAAEEIEKLREERRPIRSLRELKQLREGAALLTSDFTDTVLLRMDGQFSEGFVNSSGFGITPETLWDYGAKPFTVLWEPSDD